MRRMWALEEGSPRIHHLPTPPESRDLSSSVSFQGGWDMGCRLEEPRGRVARGGPG